MAMQIMVPLTYSDIVGIHPNESELISNLSLLNKKKTFLFLSMINLLISLYERKGEKFIKLQGSLFTSLVNDDLFESTKEKFGPENMGSRPLFFRRQVLTLMKKCLQHCSEDGGYDLSDKNQGRYELGTAALMMSDLIESEEQNKALEFDVNSKQDTERAEEEFTAQMMPNIELENPPSITASIIRNNEYFEIFKRNATNKEFLFSNGKTLHQRFQELTGLDIDTYLHLIVLTGLYYRYDIGKKEPEVLINNPALFNVGINTMFEKMNFSADEIQRFFSLAALSVEELSDALNKHQQANQLPEQHDFTVYRRYPMAYTRGGRDIMTCLDSSFLAEKTANGVYFTINNEFSEREGDSAEDLDDHKKYMSLWGKVFELYVCDRLKDARFARDLRDYYFSPQFTRSPVSGLNEAFDVALDYKSSLVVMELKGKFARLKARCSGRRDELVAEFRDGDIIGKAVKQLARNLTFVFNATKDKRHTFDFVEGARTKTYDARKIDRVRRIYPIIVHQDYFIRTIGANNIARRMFQEELAKKSIDPSLVRPLTLITVEDLEGLLPYLKTRTLPQILEKYITYNLPHETFNNFLIWFRKKNGIDPMHNEWIEQREKEMWDGLKNKFKEFS